MDSRRNISVQISSIGAGATIFFLCLIGHAANLAQMPVVFQSGNWKVHRGADSMTDRTTCTGIYKDNYGIQLSPGDLYIHVSGGIESIQVRFDDNPPERQRQATEVEKKIDSIIISGSDLTRALQAARLRISVLTMVSGVHEDDLDLAGIGDAANNIHDGCPGEPIDLRATTRATTASESGCTDRAKAKMKIRGLSEADIKDICTK